MQADSLRYVICKPIRVDSYRRPLAAAEKPHPNNGGKQWIP
jgi:hypothetical protein